MVKKGEAEAWLAAGLYLPWQASLERRKEEEGEIC